MIRDQHIDAIPQPIIDKIEALGEREYRSYQATWLACATIAVAELREAGLIEYRTPKEQPTRSQI